MLLSLTLTKPMTKSIEYFFYTNCKTQYLWYVLQEPKGPVLVCLYRANMKEEHYNQYLATEASSKGVS